VAVRGEPVRRGLLAAVCACTAARPADAQAVTATSGSPAAIARIRAAVAEVEREAPRYRRTKHDVFNFSLEGGELTGLYRGRELRKLAARLYGETWRGTEEYYFSGGRLVFIHGVTERYDEPMTGRVVFTIEHRLYLDGGRLIRKVRTQRPAAPDQSDLDPKLDWVLTNARLFTACAAATGKEPPQCVAPEM
jgi:hypothetical protein